MSANAKRIQHLGIAVRELEPAVEFYRDKLGLPLVEQKEMPDRGLRVAFLQAGDTLVELLAPLHEGSEISRFLDKRGEGIHHICFDVPDILKSLDALRKDGVRVISKEPTIGAEGYPVAFLHPKSCNGVLIELLEETLPEDAGKGGA
ncbi:MAG: methylmalonyl-CoA epimerase [Myxococcota bacterium]|jgi:methylmalonyl-CoA epimerase